MADMAGFVADPREVTATKVAIVPEAAGVRSLGERRTRLLDPTGSRRRLSDRTERCAEDGWQILRLGRFKQPAIETQKCREAVPVGGAVARCIESSVRRSAGWNGGGIAAIASVQQRVDGGTQCCVQRRWRQRPPGGRLG